MIEHLLKSSLPLEHEVAAIADECGYLNYGQFFYNQSYESGCYTGSYVELLVSADIDMTVGDVDVDKHLNVLMSCKYESRAGCWVFSAAPHHQPVTMTAFSCYPWRGDYLMRNFEPMRSLEPPVYCTSGVALSGNAADPKQIRLGLEQVRYAIPRLLEKLLDDHASYDYPAIPIIAPLLVTNAPVFVLNSGATVSDIEEAESIEKISTQQAYLTVYQQVSPELRAFCRASVAAIIDNSQNGLTSRNPDLLANNLIQSAESITVVSLSHLQTYLQKLRDVVSQIQVQGRGKFGFEFQNFVGHDS